MKTAREILNDTLDKAERIYDLDAIHIIDALKAEGFIIVNADDLVKTISSSLVGEA